MQLTEATIFCVSEQSRRETDGVLLPILSNMAANENRFVRVCTCVCVRCARFVRIVLSRTELLSIALVCVCARLCERVCVCMGARERMLECAVRQTTQHAHSPPMICHIWYALCTYTRTKNYAPLSPIHAKCMASAHSIYSLYGANTEWKRPNGKFILIASLSSDASRCSLLFSTTFFFFFSLSFFFSCVRRIGDARDQPNMQYCWKSVVQRAKRRTQLYSPSREFFVVCCRDTPILSRRFGCLSAYECVCARVCVYEAYALLFLLLPCPLLLCAFIYAAIYCITISMLMFRCSLKRNKTMMHHAPNYIYFVVVVIFFFIIISSMSFVLPHFLDFGLVAVHFHQTMWLHSVRHETSISFLAIVCMDSFSSCLPISPPSPHCIYDLWNESFTKRKREEKKSIFYGDTHTHTHMKRGKYSCDFVLWKRICRICGSKWIVRNASSF